MKENENSSGQTAQKVAQTGKNVAKFGIAAAKVFSGIATPNDWAVFLKVAIPVVFVSTFFSIMLLVIIVCAPVLAAKDSVDSKKNTEAGFFEKLGNFFTGYGYNSDDQVFFELLNDEKLSCDQATLVTATIMYYYQTVPDSEIELGELPEDTDADGNSVDIYGIDYGKLLPDLKKLVKKIKKGDSTYEDYVKNTFLVKEPYVKLLEGQVENTTESSSNTDSDTTSSDYSSESGFYENIVTANADDGHKILVNKNSKLPDNYSPDLVTVDTSYARAAGYQLERTTYSYFKQMADAAKKDGIKIFVHSGYRSHETQAYTYANYKNRDGEKAADTYSARPGHSEHETGLAMDINLADSNLHFENTKEYQWLSNNAHKYGFILRYPQGKENIHGYIFEPWHYRYLGVELATAVKESGLTYDEYYLENFGSPGSSSGSSGSKKIASNPKKDQIYDEMKLISESVECPKKNGNSMVCRGNYESAETAEIEIQDLDNVYVNVAGASCVNDDLESCTDWMAKDVPFKDYIMGVVTKENLTTNEESLKAQFIATKTYTLARIAEKNRVWHEVNGRYIIYMKGTDDDHVYGDINDQPDEVKQRFSKAYEETLNYFLLYDDNTLAVAQYCSDFGECSHCVRGQGTCFAQGTANRTTGQTFKEILGYHYSAYKLYDMSDKSIQISTVECTYAAGGGSIRFPVDGQENVVWIYSSKYGDTYNRASPHEGIDIASIGGKFISIYTIAPGYVAHAGLESSGIIGEGGGYGYHVVILHDIDSDGDFDYSTLYGHCSELLVKTGDIVSGGQEIAKMGSTGDSTGPHLHFNLGVLDNVTTPSSSYGYSFSGVLVNPTQYLIDIQNGTSIFNQMIVAERKYYYQNSYASTDYCGDGDTLAKSGALPTTFAMAVSSLKDSGVTPVSVSKTICNTDDLKKYKTNNGNTSADLLTYKPFLSKYGMTSTYFNSHYDSNIKTELNAGKVLIASVQGGIFNPTNSGHYIALMEINGSNEVLVYDPLSNINNKNTRSKYYKIDDIVGNINGLWSLK